MGIIIGSKSAKNSKVIVEVEMDYEESLQLQGHLKNVHLFSEDAAEVKANLSQRGKNEATKYFLIPKQLRNDLKFNERVVCQKIDTEDKTIFVYVVDKHSV